MVPGIGIAVAIVVTLVVSLEAGFRVGRRMGSTGEPQGGGQVGAIQGATLGLLGLLLGFSFAGAAARFAERQDLIVRETNAIGTVYLRADLLDEPYRSDLRAALVRYVEHRLTVSEGLRYGLPSGAKAEVAQLHNQIWDAARAGVVARPASIVAVLPPVNELIDLHSTRLAAGKKHVPGLVLGLLAACSVLCMSVIGYGCGLTGRRNLVMTTSLAIVISAALWTTIDLDHPRAGVIQLSDAPLRELKLGGSN